MLSCLYNDFKKSKINSNFMPQSSSTSHSSASSSSMEDDDMRTLLKAGGTILE